jgi:2-hydroxy-6-oxonona-2,4-dienedioate hydrolase
MTGASQGQPSGGPEVVYVSSAGTAVAVRVCRPAGGHPRTAPVVLLPGLIIGEYFWRHTVQFLVEHRFQVVTLCEPTAMVDASIQNFQLHIQAIFEALQLPAAVICGNSLGGLLAVEFAAAFPERTRAIVVSGAPGLENDYDVDIGARWTFDRAAVYRLAERLVHDRACIPSDEVDETVRRFTDRRFRRNLAISLRVARHHSVSAVLPRVTCPVLLVWGEKDSLTSPAEWKSSMHLLRHASFHTVADCGHAPMFERPDVFNPLLLGFLDQQEGL